MSVSKYWDEHAPANLKGKKKTLAQKKAWITKESGLQFWRATKQSLMSLLISGYDESESDGYHFS